MEPTEELKANADRTEHDAPKEDLRKRCRGISESTRKRNVTQVIELVSSNRQRNDHFH